MIHHSPHSSRADEQLFRAIFMAMDDGAILQNGSGEIIAINPAAEKLLGLDATHQALNLIHQDGTPMPREQHPAMLAFQTGKAQRNVLIGVQRPDGMPVWLSVNVQPLFIEGETVPSAVIQTFRDRTQKRLADRYEQFRSQTLELLAGGASLPELLETIIRGVERLKPEMICSILLLERGGRRLSQGVAPSLPDFYNDAINGIEIGLGVGCCGTVAATGQRVIVDDIQTHPYWIPYRELAAKAGLASCWSEPILSSSGQVLGTFAVYRREVYSPAEFDISIIEKSARLVSIAIERKRMEQDLAAREQEFRSLAETSPDFIVRYDRDGHHRYLNNRLLELLGLSSAQEVIGKRPGEAWPDDRFAVVEQAAARAMESASQVDIEFVESITSDASRYHQLYIVPERDVSGRIVGTIAFGRDITALREAERRLKHFIENLPGMAYTLRLSPDGSASMPYVSPAIEAFYGIQPQDVAHDIAPIHRLVHPDDLAHIEAGIAESARALTLFHAEYRICRSGQPVRWLEARSMPEREADGSILWYGLLLDITERKLAEAALRASEERMRLFFESRLVGMAITSPQKSWLQVNDKICEMLGYTREELARLTWAEMTFPQDLAADSAQFERLLGGEIDSYALEKRFVRKDGGIVFTDLVVGCARLADRSVDYVLAMLEDITERKRAEQERQAYAHSLECMDSVNKAIQGRTDPEQMMSDVLEVVLTFFGCDRASLMYPCDPDAPEWTVPMERTRPEYPGILALGMGSIPMDEDIAGKLRTLLNAKGVVKFGPGAERAIPLKLSEEFGVRSSLSMALFPKLDKPWQFGIHQCSASRHWTRDEEELFQKIGWRLSDALTSLLMYRNLQAREQEFHTLAENLPDVLVRYDHEGRCTYVNRALERAFQVCAEHLIGKTLEQANATGMQLPPIYRLALEHTLATGKRNEFEIQMPSLDGSIRTGLFFIAAERAADGQIIGAISIGHDITQRKSNEAELERHRHHLEKLVEDRTLALSIAKETAEAATRAKSHFLAAASHDLRQPLQAIGLFNQALTMTKLDDEQKKICRNLSKSVNSLGELLNGLLDLSRLDAGIIEPHPEVIQAKRLLKMIDAEFDAVSREKNLRLRLFCPRHGLTLFSDGNLLLTMLRNIVSNAVKYTVSGGVLVGIRQRGDRALIQVWDTGIGIAREQMDSIFEEYFQVANPERDRSKGVGLGLTIVKRLSNLLGIGLRVRSREGRGSLFELSVPLANGSNQPFLPIPTHTSLKTVADTRLAGKRLVIVEDDALAAEAIKMSLEMAGAHVTLYSTAEDALGCEKAMLADHYISDYRLPGMNGLQLLDAIQARLANPIQAVLLTGNTSPDQFALMQASRWKVLFKPIDLPKLLAAMKL